MNNEVEYAIKKIDTFLEDLKKFQKTNTSGQTIEVPLVAIRLKEIKDILCKS